MRIGVCTGRFVKRFPGAVISSRLLRSEKLRVSTHSMADQGSWESNLVTSSSEIHKADQPAFYVPEYLHKAGVNVIPVPVYYPDVTTILGKPVYRQISDVPDQIDILDVFRRPSDIPQHLDDILAARPACVWLQSGIRCPEAEQKLVQAGIRVVADRCLMVERRQAKLFSNL